MGRIIPARDAVARARRFRTYQAGMCLGYVCNALTNGRGLGVYAPYALHAWQHAHHRHPGDKHPPAGAPVFWDHGTHNNYGHVAISVGGGKVRSTGIGRQTDIGEVTIDQLSRSWGRRYLGWSEDLYGMRVPGLAVPAHVPPSRYPGHSHRRGSRHTRHVRSIQSRLRHHGQHVAVDGVYGPATERAVKDFQRAHHLTRDGIVGHHTWTALWR